MTATDDGGSISGGTLRKVFGSDISADSDGSDHTEERTVPTPAMIERNSSQRHYYSVATLRALRHNRRFALPENITYSPDVPQRKIPTLKPNPPTPFSSLSLPKELFDALASLSLTTATPIQATAIPYARLGGDLVAQATSGTGKTLTYALVALDTILPPTPTKSALIIVPARELASQVAEVFTKLSAVRVVTLVGGTKERIDEERLSRPTNVIVGTPGRVEAMVTRGALDVASVKILVLDEADRLLDGSFSGSVERVCNMLPTRQTLAFSATFSYSFRTSLLEVMREPAWIGGSQVVHSVTQLKSICFDQKEKIDSLERSLGFLNFDLCMVFLNAKKAAGRLVRTLTKSFSFQSRLMHAGMTQKERDAVIRDVRQGKVRVLVTTDVLARGIDFDSCDYVVHMDVPLRAETYLHRVGRAGRFGRRGCSLLLCDEGEISALRALEDDLGYVIQSLLEPNVVVEEGRFKLLESLSKDAGDKMQSLPKEVAPVVEQGGHRDAGRKGHHPDDVNGNKNEAQPKESKTPACIPTSKDAQTEDQNPKQNVRSEKLETSSKAPKDSNKASLTRLVSVTSPSSVAKAIPKQAQEKNDTSFNVTTPVALDEIGKPGEEVKKAQLLQGTSKRARFSEEPTTPAKKRKSARLFFESLPLYDKDGSGGANAENFVHSRKPTAYTSNTPAKRRERTRLDSEKSVLQQNNDGCSPVNMGATRFETSNDGNSQRIDALRTHLGEKGTDFDREAAQRRNRISALDHPRRRSDTEAEQDVVLRDRDQTDGASRGATLAASQARVEESHSEDIPYDRQSNDNRMNGDEHVAQASPEIPTATISQQSREAWDRYAEAAYDTGYREAYEEAFRMARELRQRLEESAD